MQVWVGKLGSYGHMVRMTCPGSHVLRLPPCWCYVPLKLSVQVNWVGLGDLGSDQSRDTIREHFWYR